MFFHLLISFFGVLPCIDCKIEIFNINKSTSTCYVATLLGSWALCRKSYSCWQQGLWRLSVWLLARLSLCVVFVVCFSYMLCHFEPLTDMSEKLPPLPISYSFVVIILKQKNPLYDFCICIMHNLFIIIINIKRTIILLNTWILLFIPHNILLAAGL